MDVLVALSIMLMAGLAWLPWLLTGLHPGLAVALALNAGVLVAGFVHIAAALLGTLSSARPVALKLVESSPASGAAAGRLAGPLVMLLTLAMLALAFYLRRRWPLAAETNAVALAPENRKLRILSIGLWVPILVVLGYYLWANALRPPILAGTIFTWSAPAREGAPFWPLPLAASALYYKLALSDAGWKFFWSLLSLSPWLAVVGAILQHGRRGGQGLFAASVAVAGLAAVFSLLFWGSAAFPDVFLAGSVFLMGGLLSTPGRAAWLAAIPAAVLLWSGPFWIGLGGVIGLASALQGIRADSGRPSARPWLVAAAIAALGLWAVSTGLAFAAVASDIPAWNRMTQAAAYLLRDAWNPIRYGALTYGIAALAFRYAARRSKGNGDGAKSGLADLVWVPLALLGMVVVDVAAREGMAFELLLRFEGNRALSAGLLIAWCWAWLRSCRAMPDAA